MRAVFMQKHVFVLLNIWEKGWKVATEDFVLFILFAIGKKFSFPTFFQLQYCELVTCNSLGFAMDVFTQITLRDNWSSTTDSARTEKSIVLSL